MSIKFIHIGMMKTATTYMQNIWLRDKQFALAFKGVIPVVQYIRRATLENTFNSKKSINIKVDQQPMETQDIIISQEGFTCGYLTDIEERPIRELIQNSSELLGTLNGQTDNILICVRSPVSWLRSMHSQFVNEGQFGDGERFMTLKEKFLRDSMDLKFIVECYRKFFGNVVVLPLEYLQQDEHRFWGTVKEKFSVAIPGVDAPPINETVSGIRLPLMSRLNEVSHTMRDSLSASKRYNNQEREVLVRNSISNDRWFNRRFCQHAEDREIQRMCDRLNVDDNLVKFRKVPISASFAECINENFITPIEEVTKDQVLVDQYRKELWREVM